MSHAKHDDNPNEQMDGVRAVLAASSAIPR